MFLAEKGGQNQHRSSLAQSLPRWRQRSARSKSSRCGLRATIEQNATVFDDVFKQSVEKTRRALNLVRDEILGAMESKPAPGYRLYVMVQIGAKQITRTIEYEMTNAAGHLDAVCDRVSLLAT